MVKPDDDLLQQTRRLYEASYRFDAVAAAALGLHVTDLRCINALENRPISAGEIGSRLALTSGSVTALVQRLVRAGYARQIRDDSDGRRSLVELTPRFYAESAAVYEQLGTAISASFADVPEAEQRAAAVALSRLAEGFQAAARTLDAGMIAI